MERKGESVTVLIWCGKSWLTKFLRILFFYSGETLMYSTSAFDVFILEVPT